MKLNDFIEHIASLDFDWKLDGEAISSDDNDDCPIWTMYRRHGDRDDDDEFPEDVYQAGRRLGLTTIQVTRFIDAADRANTAYKGLRERLLAATVNKS